MKKQVFQSQESEDQSLIQTRQVNLSSKSQYYENRMSTMKRKSKQFFNNLNILENNGFDYSRQFSFEFKKTIIKSSRDSARYEIQYGHFRTYITASFSQYNFQTIKRSEIGRGNFGIILQFQHQQKTIIAKSFSHDENNLQQTNCVFKQLFWVKFASALKISPKFINLYGFDLIFLKNRCQFLMEECRCNFKFAIQYQISEQQFQKSIKEIVQTLHSFHAIHGDIKTRHIAWSFIHQKIVLIDFGLAQFVKQQIGQMTLTQYFGTFSYSCPEMKKAYILKSAVLVDLFYNDLYGLEQCLKMANSQGSDLFKVNIVQSDNKQWQLVVILFKLKFDMFQQKYKEAIQLCRKYQFLKQCFRLIIKDKQKYVLNQFSAYYWGQVKRKMNFSHYNFQANHNSVKNLIYIQLLKSYNNPKFYRFQISEALVKNMYKNETLEIFLDCKDGRESMFEFAFQQKNLSRSQIKSKLNVIKYIYLAINKPSQKKKHELPSSQRQMVLSVLLMFQEYFYKAGNLEKLENIENIFRLTCQVRYLRKVQKNICQIFLKNSDLWLDRYRKGIAIMFNHDSMGILFNGNKNPRSNWEWLTTLPQLQKQFLQTKNLQLFEACTNIIKEIDRKVASQCLNVQYDQNLLSKAFKRYEKQLFAQAGNRKDYFQIVEVSNKLLLKFEGKIQWITDKNISLEDFIISGLIKFSSQGFSQFITKLASLSSILRKTVWHLVYYHKFNDITAINNCLQYLFEDVFVADTAQGINNFAIFSILFSNNAFCSGKGQQLMIKFLKCINIQTILCQISSDAYSLKQTLLNFLQIFHIFMEIQNKQVIPILDNIFNKIVIFFSRYNNQWWVAPQSQITILIKITKVYYPALRDWQELEMIDKMVLFAQQIIEKKYSMKLLCFVVMAFSQSIIANQRFQNSLDAIWQVLSKIQDKHTMFAIIQRNLRMFTKIITRLCHNQQFQQCFQAIQQYGKQLKTQIVYINCYKINTFYNFVNSLPQKAATKIFINDLDTFNLKRIGQSPHLALILLFILNKQQFKSKIVQKIRYIRLISFGLSKIKIRYNMFIQINGLILYFNRLFIPFKSIRKQISHYQRQARISHSQNLSQMFLKEKEKKLKKLKIKKKSQDIKELILKKISKVNLIIQI